MCVESVCGVCAESVWDVRFVFWCCGVLWCVVCVLSVCGAAWHAEKPSVCRFKTSPCVRSKRFRVYRQNARMCSSWQQQGDKGHKQLTSNSDSNTVRSPNVSVQKSRAFQPLSFPYQTLDIHAGRDIRTPQHRSRKIEQFPQGQGNVHKTWALRQAAR